MDISPLPHKVPFSFAQGIKAHSPSPVPTPDEDMISPCDAQSNNQLQVPQERPLEYVDHVPTLSAFFAYQTSDGSDPPFYDPPSRVQDSALQVASTTSLRTSCPSSPLVLVVMASAAVHQSHH